MPSPVACEISELPTPKRQKLELGGKETSSSSDSDSEDFDEEDLRLFGEEFNKSEGFDIDFSKLCCTYSCRPVIFDENYIVCGPDTDGALLERLSKLVIEKRNEEEGTNLEFVRVVKANYHPGGAFTLYITFEAKDPSNCQSKPYQALVSYLPMQIEIIYCRPKPCQKDVCWAVAITRCIEATLSVKKKDNSGVKLSAQHLINNIKNMDKDGQVKKYDEIISFLVHHGLVSESECQYSGQIKKSCSHKTSDDSALKIKDLVRTKRKSVKEDLIKLVDEGPSVVVMDLCQSLLDFKGDGIYRGPNRKEQCTGRHVVIVSGFGTIEEGIHYCIVQNSWGEKWGG